MRKVKDSLKKYIVLFFLTSGLFGCGEEVTLLSKLAEPDANEIVGALLSEGLQAKKLEVKDGVSVIIDIRDMSRAVQILKAAGLPNKSQANLGEVFKKEGIISTPLEERARYIYALSQELEYTLSQIDNVILARVHVVLPERVAPGQPIQPSSAAIFIKHTPDLDPDVIEPRVRGMVASSIPGLNKAISDKISVSFVESEPFVVEVSWQNLGPFIVQEASIAPLKRLLIACFSISVLFLAIAVVMTLEKSRTWLVTRIPPLSKIAA